MFTLRKNKQIIFNSLCNNTGCTLPWFCTNLLFSHIGDQITKIKPTLEVPTYTRFWRHLCKHFITDMDYVIITACNLFKTILHVLSHTHGFIWGLGWFVFIRHGGGGGVWGEGAGGSGSSAKETLPILDLQRLASLLILICWMKKQNGIQNN